MDYTFNKWIIFSVLIATCYGCGFPGAPAHSTVSFSNDGPNTIATYTCDRGFELLGPALKTCLENGTWVPSGIPFCVLNVAAGKAPMQSSVDDNLIPQKAVDGSTSSVFSRNTCTMTKNERQPWWYVNLLEPYMVQLVRLDFGLSCCDDEPATIVVRVGNSRPDLGVNPVCNKFVGHLEEGRPLFLPCNPPLPGAFVSVHFERPSPTRLSICEAFVYTDQALPIERCPSFADLPVGSTSTYNGKCYLFYNRSPMNFDEALDFCRARGGSLLDETNPALQGFLSWELWRRHRGDANGQYWLGAVRDPKDPNNWKWINNKDVTVSFWNLPGGNENCARFDGTKGWLWSDTNCMARLNYICQHRPRECGKPEQPPNSTMIAGNYEVGQNVEYECDPGHIMLGEPSRRCLNSGFFDQFPPTCKYVECGLPAFIRHGRYDLINGTRSYQSIVEYSCDENYSLIGRSVLTCDSDAKWNGPPPRCERSSCGEAPVVLHASLLNPSNGSFNIPIGGSAEYSCNQGYTMVGNSVVECTEEGFTAELPSCQAMDCGKVPGVDYAIHNASLSKVISYGQIIHYECTPGFVLLGSPLVQCTANGFDFEPPTCQAMTCDQIPAIENGFHDALLLKTIPVGSFVNFMCDKGYNLMGSETIKCTENGFDLPIPTCQAQNCDPIPEIEHGSHDAGPEVSLGSVVNYKCDMGYKLMGSQKLTCTSSGFDSKPPLCQAQTCDNIPDIENGSHDGGAEVSLGSVVNYECNMGYKLLGSQKITCTSSGFDSKSPHCEEISCGFAPSISHGVKNSTLPLNYGESVRYSCLPGYKLIGSEDMVCGTDGFRSIPPRCKAITCGPSSPIENGFSDVELTSEISVGQMVTFRCKKGYSLMGSSVVNCTENGFSSEFPECKVDTVYKPNLSEIRPVGNNIDRSYETNAIDDSEISGSRVDIVSIIPPQKGDNGGNEVYRQNDRGQAVNNPEFTQEEDFNLGGPQLHTGGMIALGVFGGFVILAAIITTVVILVRRTQSPPSKKYLRRHDDGTTSSDASSNDGHGLNKFYKRAWENLREGGSPLPRDLEKAAVSGHPRLTRTETLDNPDYRSTRSVGQEGLRDGSEMTVNDVAAMYTRPEKRRHHHHHHGHRHKSHERDHDHEREHDRHDRDRHDRDWRDRDRRKY